MKILDKEKDIEVCVARFRNMLEDQYGIDLLVERLDSIHCKYSQYALNDSVLGGNRNKESNELWLLKDLRDLFITKTE